MCACPRHRSVRRATLPRSPAAHARSTRASPSATSTCARPTSTACAASTSTCSASTSSPRRATCPAGAPRATSSSSPPAAITITWASTRGSRPAAVRSPTASRACTTWPSAIPTRAGLADALRRLQSVDWPLRQVTDHGTHEAIYISDPDGNDLELCWDRPFDEWPLDGDGHIGALFGDLDLEDLLRSRRPRASATGRARWPAAPGRPSSPGPALPRSTRPMVPTTIIAATSAAMAHLLIPSSASMLSALSTHLGAT